jgi:putative tricarboxylic transport membrane protein
MRVHDALSGSLLALLAIAVLFTVRQYPSIPGQNIGPAAFPAVLASILLVCSVILIWRGLRAERAPMIQVGAWMQSPRHVLNFLLIPAALLFYVWCSESLGFLPTGVIILAVLFYSLNVWLRLILPVAVIMTLLIHTIFYKFLRVPLPWGPLQGMAW